MRDPTDPALALLLLVDVAAYAGAMCFQTWSNYPHRKEPYESSAQQSAEMVEQQGVIRVADRRGGALVVCGSLMMVPAARLAWLLWRWLSVRRQVVASRQGFEVIR